jgi:hypothetical protein
MNHPFVMVDDHGFYFANLAHSTMWRVKRYALGELGYQDTVVETMGSATRAVEMAIAQGAWA